MKKLPAVILALAIIFTLSACEEKPVEHTEPAETTAATEVTTIVPETTAKPVTTTVPETTEKPAETLSPEEIEKAENYAYQPTDSIKNVSWYHDNILKTLNPEDMIRTENEVTPNITDDELRESFYKILPKDIVDKAISGCFKNLDRQITHKETDRIWNMGYYKFDLDDNGTDDYIIYMDCGTPDFRDEGTLFSSMQHFYPVYKVVKVYDDGWTRFIDMPNEPIWNILKTKTEGMHDFLVGNDGNTPVMRYISGRGYVSYDESDERHTFSYAERVNENVIKINLKISVGHDMESDYYTAVKFMDNPYLKENVLYACEPDGTPKSYDKDFRKSAIDGYDFYAELKDGVKLPENYRYEFFPDEIRYVFEHGTENYKYQPPKEVTDAHFHGAEIEKRIEFENEYMPEFYNYTKFYDEDCRERLLEDFYKHYPKEIVDDLNNAIVPEMDKINERLGDDYYNEKDKASGKIFQIGQMKYDLNSDGIEDYIIHARASTNGDTLMYEPDLYRIYLVNADGTYKSIWWDCYMQWNPAYILKTSTNGLKDIMILHNANYPIITYDGKDSYPYMDMLDEKHTFVSEEILPNNILHYNVDVFVKGADAEEYYAAIYMADNPYLENNLLYSCYPDGTPMAHLESEHNKAHYGYDFYVKLKDGANIYDNTGFLDIVQIRYIPVK